MYPLLIAIGQPINVCNLHVLDDCLIDSRTTSSFSIFINHWCSSHWSLRDQNSNAHVYLHVQYLLKITHWKILIRNYGSQGLTSTSKVSCRIQNLTLPLDLYLLNMKTLTHCTLWGMSNFCGGSVLYKLCIIYV